MACPDWVAGELCIGGSGVARGYWQDEEKTAAHFFQDAYTGTPWYRTGDRGYYRDDGVIVDLLFVRPAQHAGCATPVPGGKGLGRQDPGA